MATRTEDGTGHERGSSGKLSNHGNHVDFCRFWITEQSLMVIMDSIVTFPNIVRNMDLGTDDRMHWSYRTEEGLRGKIVAFTSWPLIRSVFGHWYRWSGKTRNTHRKITVHDGFLHAIFIHLSLALTNEKDEEVKRKKQEEKKELEEQWAREEEWAGESTADGKEKQQKRGKEGLKVFPLFLWQPSSSADRALGGASRSSLPLSWLIIKETGTNDGTLPSCPPPLLVRLLPSSSLTAVTFPPSHSHSWWEFWECETFVYWFKYCARQGRELSGFKKISQFFSSLLSLSWFFLFLSLWAIIFSSLSLYFSSFYSLSLFLLIYSHSFI